MVGTGLVIRIPRIAAIGSSFAIFFWNFISPDNSARIDDVAFLNSALATLVGIAYSTVLFAILFPTDQKSIRARLYRAVCRDLAEIARSPGEWNAHAWLSRTADRLSRLLVIGSAVPRATSESELRGLIASWAIGDSLLALHNLARKQPIARRPAAVVLKRLRRFDVGRLASVCDLAASRLKRHSNELDVKDRRELLRASIFVQTLAESAKAHADFLRSALGTDVEPAVALDVFDYAFARVLSTWLSGLSVVQMLTGNSSPKRITAPFEAFLNRPPGMKTDTFQKMRMFVRVAESARFTAAAVHLQMTASDVSRAVSDLEERMRARLLNRTTRRVAVDARFSREHSSVQSAPVKRLVL